jgi:hypothetical protein
MKWIFLDKQKCSQKNDVVAMESNNSYLPKLPQSLGGVLGISHTAWGKQAKSGSQASYMQRAGSKLEAHIRVCYKTGSMPLFL